MRIITQLIAIMEKDRSPATRIWMRRRRTASIPSVSSAIPMAPERRRRTRHRPGHLRRLREIHRKFLCRFREQEIDFRFMKEDNLKMHEKGKTQGKRSTFPKHGKRAKTLGSERGRALQQTGDFNKCKSTGRNEQEKNRAFSFADETREDAKERRTTNPIQSFRNPVGQGLAPLRTYEITTGKYPISTPLLK